jgi:predicted Rossmann-fold nucleotide-binding protein
VWTTATLDLHHKPIILVNTAGFYDGMLSWLDRLADTEFVRRPALDRLVVVDSVEAALDAIPAGT